MGIYINIKISKAVTKEEWEKVYKETLFLAKKFPLAETKTISKKGIEIFCLVPTKETIEIDEFSNEETRGWYASGDYNTLRRAETDYTPRELVVDKYYNPEAGDAMMAYLPQFLDYDEDDERFDNSYWLWGNKTQGEPYHMYLLAIACLIEDRLGKKAFVSGDITRGQCRKAVEMANVYLKKKIDIPARCDMNRLMKRLRELDIADVEKMEAFDYVFLGTKDNSFGDCLRAHFSETALDEYWRKKFYNSPVGTYAFDDCLSNYLIGGFDFDKLCQFIVFDEDQGKKQYEDFVVRIMDAKLYLPDKDCEDVLKTDQENPAPYSIWSMLAQFAFAGARNKKIDRFIPIDQIRSSLNKRIGNKCDVDIIIDEYLEKEKKQIELDLSNADNLSDEELKNVYQQDPSKTFNAVVKKKEEAILQEKEEFDITDLGQAKFYKKGDTMPETIKKNVGLSRQFLDKLIDEDEYRELMEATPKSRMKWVADNNHYLMIRDCDWDAIFNNIADNKDSFGRYYSVMRTKMESRDLSNMGVAFVINDDFYEYSGELAKEYS